MRKVLQKDIVKLPQELNILFKPAWAVSDVDFEGNVELDGGRHFPVNPLCVFFSLLRRQLEDKLIVYLQNHLYGQISRFDFSLDIYHSDLYQVGGGALDNGVDGHTFCPASLVGIFAVNIL